MKAGETTMTKETGCGQLPRGWKITSIKDVANVTVSPVDKRSLETEEKVFLCNYTDVYYNSAITKDMDFMAATASRDEIQKFSLRADDVVITKDSETPEDIGVPAYVASVKDNLLCGYHLAILRPKEGACGKFLMYALLSKKVAHDFYRYSNGITRFGLTGDTYAKVKIYSPSWLEQKAIADCLSLWDEAIAKTEALIAAKERRFGWLLRTLIGRQKHDTKLMEVCQYGQDLPSEKGGENLGYLEIGDIDVKQKNYNIAGKSKMPVNGAVKVPRNTVLVSTVRPTRGAIVKTKSDIYVSPAFCRFKLPNDFFFYCLHQNRFFTYLKAVESGGTYPTVKDDDILNFKVPNPPLAEQNRIAGMLAAAAREIALLNNLAASYAKQKRGLMQKLLTGEWRTKT